MVVILIWIAVAIGGIGMQWVALRDAVDDLAWLRTSSRNQKLLLLARQHVRTAVIRFYVCSGNLVIGVLTLVVVKESRYAAVVNAIVVAQLLIAEASQIALTYYDRRTRRHIVEMDMPSIATQKGSGSKG